MKFNWNFIIASKHLIYVNIILQPFSRSISIPLDILVENVKCTNNEQKIPLALRRIMFEWITLKKYSNKSNKQFYLETGGGEGDWWLANKSWSWRSDAQLLGLFKVKMIPARNCDSNKCILKTNKFQVIQKA